MGRALVRPGGDLLVINLLRVEKARDEAKELPGQVSVRSFSVYCLMVLPPNFFKSSILISSSCSLS